MTKNIFYSIKTCALISNQGRTQGGLWVRVKKTLELDILQKRYYLLTGD